MSDVNISSPNCPALQVVDKDRGHHGHNHWSPAEATLVGQNRGGIDHCNDSVNDVGRHATSVTERHGLHLADLLHQNSGRFNDNLRDVSDRINDNLSDSFKDQMRDMFAMKSQMQECCCEIKSLVTERAMATDTLIRETVTQGLRDQLDAARQTILTLQLGGGSIPLGR